MASHTLRQLWAAMVINDKENNNQSHERAPHLPDVPPAVLTTL